MSRLMTRAMMDLVGYLDAKWFNIVQCDYFNAIISYLSPWRGDFSFSDYLRGTDSCMLRWMGG